MTPAMQSTAVYGCNIALSWFGAKYCPARCNITTGQLNALFGYIMNILMSSDDAEPWRSS